MRHNYFLPIFVALFLIISAGPAFGQDQTLVVMVLNPDIQTNSPFDDGPDGISRLEGIFQQLGAQTQVINLIEAIPIDADVVVIVGPRQPLSIVALARIWLHLVHGHHLLLALDPPGYANTLTETSNSSLLNIITNGYGLITLDGFLAEPWFTKDSASILSGTYMRTYPDVVPHSVVEPLIKYGLPVQVWGARPVRIEPIGIDSHAVPLLETSTAYAETSSGGNQQRRFHICRERAALGDESGVGHHWQNQRCRLGGKHTLPITCSRSRRFRNGAKWLWFSFYSWSGTASTRWQPHLYRASCCLVARPTRRKLARATTGLHLDCN
jgi:hypothetical protein